MKKLISLGLAFFMLISLASCKKETAQTFTPENFEFTLRNSTDKMGFDKGYSFVELDDGSVMITESIVEGNLNIPSELSGKKVTAIGDGAFFGNTSARELSVPDTVEWIGTYAFGDCTSLEKVTVPSSVWRISPFAFEGTPWFDSLTDEFVTAGDSVLIKYNGTSHTPVLPDNIRHLGGAFTGNANIRSITFGKGLLTVSDMALSACSSLVSVELGMSLVYVGDQAFSGSDKITVLLFPSTLRYIGSQACLNCYNLKYVDLGQSLTAMGNNTFEYCQGLRTLFIPSTITELRSSHFTDCMSFSLLLFGGSEETFAAVAKDDNLASFKRINKIFNYTGGINE